MDIGKIKSLKTESDKLEFKSSTAKLKGAFETICGFLNNQGGSVLIGVNDKGEPLGQNVTDKTRQEIAHEIQKIEPPIRPNIEYLQVTEDKEIIIIEVNKGKHAPYIYDGRPFERTQSTTKIMPQQRYDQLLTERNQLNYSWEKFVSSYDINSLDHELILGIVLQGVREKRLPEIAMRQDVGRILQNFNLINDGKISNAAIVLFGTKFMPDYPQCQLKMARFKGIDRSEFLDIDLIYGNIFTLLDKSMFFVRKHLPVAARIEEGKLARVERSLIPFDAIREAIVNALCHSDYSIISGSIGLAIYDNRMEIFNRGGLPHGITLEQLKLGLSSPRNPIIAEVCYKCNIIEKWGRGIQDIIRKCINAECPEPEFIANNVEFKVVFMFPTSLRPVVNIIDERNPKELSTRQQEIVEILISQNKALSSKDILQFLVNPPAYRTLKDDLAVLKRLGIIDLQGQARNSVWVYIGNQ